MASNTAASNYGILSIGDSGKYDFDPKLIQFREPRDLPSGAKLIMLAYGNGRSASNFMIETPTLFAPMGKSCWDNAGGPPKHSIMLSLRDHDTNPEVMEFHELIKQVDDVIRAAGFDNCKAWFKKTYKTADTVNELYTPLERKSKNKDGEEDGKYPPSLKLTLQYADGQPKFETYDRSGKKIDIEGVDLKGSNITAIITLQSVWIAGGNMFGVSAKVAQLMVEPRTTGFSGCAFRHKTLLPQADCAPAVMPAALIEDSSDDEEEVDAQDV